MRFSLLVTALLLTACGTPTTTAPCTPGESRACTCLSGAVGAQVCEDDGSRLGPCECLTIDGGGELDASLVRDAGQSRDSAAPDAPAVDAGMGYPGPCRVIPQSGCGSGQACRLFRGPAGLESVCGRAGSLGEGEEWAEPFDGCYEHDDAGIYDACQPGLVCNGVCERFCIVGGPADQCPLLGGFAMRCEEIDPGFPIGVCHRAP